MTQMDWTLLLLVSVLIFFGFGMSIYDYTRGNEYTEATKQFINESNLTMSGKEKIELASKICEKRFPENSDWNGDNKICNLKLIEKIKV